MKSNNWRFHHCWRILVTTTENQPVKIFKATSRDAAMLDPWMQKIIPLTKHHVLGPSLSCKVFFFSHHVFALFVRFSWFSECKLCRFNSFLSPVIQITPKSHQQGRRSKGCPFNGFPKKTTKNTNVVGFQRRQKVVTSVDASEIPSPTHLGWC